VARRRIRRRQEGIESRPERGHRCRLSGEWRAQRGPQLRVARGEGGGGNRLVGRSIETSFLGDASEHVLDVGGQRLRMIQTPPLFDPPEELAVEFDPEDVVVLEQ